MTPDQAFGHPFIQRAVNELKNGADNEINNEGKTEQLKANMKQFSAEPNPEDRQKSVADIREQANQNRLTKQSLTGSDKEENEDEDSESSNSNVSNLSGSKSNSSKRQT